MEVLSAINLISVLLTFLYVAIVLIFVRGWYRLQYFKPTPTKGKTRVSVIVAARNEEAGINLTLDALVAQNYPKELTEIIFIDDHSTDRTAEVISSYAQFGVKLIVLNENKALNSYKKKAIQTAIAQSSGELIVTTDADCRMGEHWLSTIVAYYEQHDYKMISSPVGYFEEKSFFERAQSLEFLYLIGLGASTIGNGKPSTCNGANLSYEKSSFYEVGGFQGIDDLASGDDELLLHKIAARYPGKVGFLKNEEAIVYTHAKTTLKDFIQQRKRWASKSTKYKEKSIIFLGIAVWLFNLSIFLNLGAGFYNSLFFKFALFQFVLKIVVEYVFLSGVTKFSRRRNLLILLPALSIMHIVYMIYIGIAGNSGKYNWKGRMVK